MSNRNHNIDILKAIAIISVILLHSLMTETLYKIAAPYHIWQAVPVFMLMAGYNTANSYKRRSYGSLNQFYNFSFLYKKLERLIYPFFLVWLMQVTALYLVSESPTFTELIYSLITGGWGPGSYFIPIIIQATLILPVIYLLSEKKLTIMTIVLFLFSMGLEMFSLMINISEEIYRLLVFRYIFALMLGVWLALNSKKYDFRWLIPLAAISFIYITGVNYFEWTFLMEDYWQSQHTVSYFWTLLLVIAMLELYQFKAENMFSKLFIKIGRASYHVFLVQMAYFWVEAIILPDMSEIMFSVISLVVCVVLGLIFFEFDNWIRILIKKGNKFILT